MKLTQQPPDQMSERERERVKSQCERVQRRSATVKAAESFTHVQQTMSNQHLIKAKVNGIKGARLPGSAVTSYAHNYGGQPGWRL